MFSLRFTERAQRSLKKIPKPWQKRIFQAVEKLKLDPYVGKKLQGQLIGTFSFRVWPYRILYILRKQELLIVVLDIGHRQDIYHQ